MGWRGMRILDYIKGLGEPERKSVTLPKFIRDALDGYTGASRPSEQLFGIPAVLSAIRLIAETSAMLPLHVYKDVPHGHERDPKAKQNALLRRRPAPDLTPFDWRSDAFAMLLGYGNFYAEKISAGSGTNRHVRFLVPFDPRIVKAEWVDRKIVYTVNPTDGSQSRTMTAREMFHVRGFTFHGEAAGLSPIGLCRRALSSGVSLEEFFMRFLRNNARPGGILEFPNTVAEEEAERILETWAQTYGGPENAGKTGILGGGATWKTVGMSLQDAQFIEHHNFSVEQVARIFNIPAKMLATGSGGGNTAGAATVSPDIGYFATMTLGPWLTRFDAALNSDVSIFPDDSGLFAEHKADALLRPDTRERYEAYRAARQGGWITPNELRRWENLPPIEGGDEIQLTPVGGAPNPGNEDEPDPAPSNDNDDTEEETE